MVFLAAANNVDALNGTGALGLWVLTIVVVLGFTLMLVMSMNTGLRLEERKHIEELDLAADNAARRKRRWRVSIR